MTIFLGEIAMIIEKNVSDSITQNAYIVMPKHINGQKRLFGGQLMDWIDVVASICARRHANSNVVTVMVDKLNFEQSANINDLLVLEAKITFVGKTSMEIRVDTMVENLEGERKRVNKAYIVMVAVDENKKPKEVPRLIIETKEEKREYLKARRRYQLRKKRRIENF